MSQDGDILRIIAAADEAGKQDRKEPTACAICGSKESPDIFRDDPWCSDQHRKVFTGELPPTPS